MKDEKDNKIAKNEADKKLINIFLQDVEKNVESIKENKIEELQNKKQDGFIEIKNDKDMSILKKSDIKAMTDHNTQFNSLLKNYVKHAEKNLKRKLLFKTIFFIVCLIILSTLIVFLIGVSIYSLKNNISTKSIVPVLVTNIISFLTSFIILPDIMAKYLFDPKEDENMTTIIKNIQDYDKEIRNKL